MLIKAKISQNYHDCSPGLKTKHEHHLIQHYLPRVTYSVLSEQSPEFLEDSANGSSEMQAILNEEKKLYLLRFLLSASTYIDIQQTAVSELSCKSPNISLQTEVI